MSPDARLKAYVRAFKRELYVYRLVLVDARTPRVAKIFLGLAVGYLLLPFDLIPDFIPVIGQLDDLLIVPGLIFVALRLVPAAVLEDCRLKAREQSAAH